MKYILYISLFLVVASCGKQEACDQIEYSVEFEAQEGEKFCFPDNNSFQITKVNDELCPCNSTCIFAGFISIDVELILEGETIRGTLTNDPILSNEVFFDDLKLPPNYKILIVKQDPQSNEICGTQVKPEDFKFTLKIGKN